MEDSVRLLYKQNNVGITYINNTWDICQTNESRARTKREINRLFNSKIIEEKKIFIETSEE